MSTSLRRNLLSFALIALLFVGVVFAQDYPERFDTIRERLANRNFPSVLQPWAGVGWRRVHNRDDLSDMRVIALHDVFFSHNFRGWGWRYNPETDFIELDEDYRRARDMVRTLELMNPNIVILIEIRMKTAAALPGNDRYPDPDTPHPYWIRDAAGNPVRRGSRILVDFTHPRVQEMIIQQAVFAQESGLLDGVMFDWWHEGSITEGYRTTEVEMEARLNILRGIRERTPPDFIIMGNTNDRKIPITAEYINGAFMETFPRGGGAYSTQNIIHLENTVRWLNDNLREPQIVCLETHTAGNTPLKILGHPNEVRVMRMFSTLGLTHSEGTVLHAHDRGHRHYWHDFWDADLGQPLGPRYQRYNNTAGLYIREFTNGYAVYNRRDENEGVEFEIPVASVTSEKYDYIHEIPAMDGEIYLKMSMTKVHPRDLLTTQWGKLKYLQR